jgi:hypothetical protein
MPDISINRAIEAIKLERASIDLGEYLKSAHPKLLALCNYGDRTKYNSGQCTCPNPYDVFIFLIAGRV